MGARTALARLTDLATREVVPFGERIGRAIRRGADDLALRALGPDFASRALLLREELERKGGDPFGLDSDWSKYSAALAAVFHRGYFRTECFGIEHVPPGRALLISNHSGQVPIDAAMINVAMFLDAKPPRFVRAMVEKWSQTLPFVGTFFNRVGQVVGVPENCRLLLERDELILVFPEGVRGVSKPFSKRYQLQEFGLGFMRLAIETRAPIVPVAVIGAEEQYVNVTNIERFAKVFGLPSFPVIPQALVPFGQFPLPTRYRIHFGEPMWFDGDPDDEDAVMEQKVWLVRQTVQSMLNRGLKERKSVFF